jgi:hypothetical protein
MLSSRNEEVEMSDMLANGGRDAEYDSNSINSSSQSSARRRGTVTGITTHDTTDIPPLTPAEQRLANRGFLRKSLGIFLLICGWYLFSISITVVSYSSFASLHTNPDSITNGCFKIKEEKRFSLFLCSPPVYICWSSFLWLLSFSF